MGYRACVLIPTYDNPKTIAVVVREARTYLPEVIVIDDGSHEEARAVIASLARDGLATVHHRPVNGGKGAALATGFRLARSLGYTHVLQVDGDGQHDLERIPAFLQQSMARPHALVLGYPVFDASVPKAREWGRKISRFWANVETGGRRILDPLTGFRVYPLDDTIAAGARGMRMETDLELAVRIVWRGNPVFNLPVGVRYLRPEEGGVSHFRMFADNVRISWMHARLTTISLLRLVGRLVRGTT